MSYDSTKRKFVEFGERSSEKKVQQRLRQSLDLV